MVFSGLAPLVVEDVVDEEERIVVRARTPQGTAVCPLCGASSGRVHGFHLRTVADVPVDGRRVVVRVRVRRLVCPTRGCRQTFREQTPGVLERHQRRTARLTRHVKAVQGELQAAGAFDIALLIVDWVVDGPGPKGEHVHIEGTATDVARRGADGRWRYIIDNPFGTARPDA